MAAGADPQQRLLLECTYEAMENAGIPKETLAGRKVGVFVGSAASDYRLGAFRDLDNVPMHEATGLVFGILGRQCYIRYPNPSSVG